MAMQRWILLAGAGVIGLVLAFFGARFAWREYHLSKPSRIWVPIPLRADISMADQGKLVEQINQRLGADEILRGIVIETGLQAKLALPTEDAAVKELGRRIFVEAGTADTPMGLVPAIHVGMSGNGHEKVILEECSIRAMKDVWRMLGIDPETGKPLQQPPPPAPGSF
jgi:hypothetical protein